MIEIRSNGSRIYNNSSDVDERGEGEHDTRDKVHDIPNMWGDFEHAEMKGSCLPHSGEGEEGERDRIVRNVPLHNPAPPKGYSCQFFWGGEIHKMNNGLLVHTKRRGEERQEWTMEGGENKKDGRWL